MSTFVIGDIQGCLSALQRLLDICRFDPARDHVIFTGDLVARGPESLQTLRFIRRLGDSATTVLGNHDLHLLALLHGHGHAGPDLQPILIAPDRDELAHWLRHRSLAHLHTASDTLIVHAGLAPQWSLEDALELADEVQRTLRDDRHAAIFLNKMYGNQPDTWRAGLAPVERRRFTINCLTRARYCTGDGRFEFRQKGPPGSQSAELLPWFMAPGRKTRAQNVVFGHWSSLGRIAWPEWSVWGLDTGYIWGGRLSALRLEDHRLFDVGHAE